MDQYFNLMKKIVKERKISPQIKSMVQDVIDLRLVSVWLFMHMIFVLSAQSHSWVQSPALCSGYLWSTIYFPHRGLFHWSFWPSGTRYWVFWSLSAKWISTTALVIEFEHLFRETGGRKNSVGKYKLGQRQTWTWGTYCTLLVCAWWQRS